MNSLSIAQALVEATQILRKAGIESARRDAATILADLIARDSAFLIAHAEDPLTAKDVARYRDFVERRAAGEPVQYIIGHQEFFNLDFNVTPDVLIPRPETELLVEKTLDLMPREELQNICDVGTGSGCIAISILHERPQACVTALDISRKALVVAERNAKRHGVLDRLELIVSDCFTELDNAQPKFDLIVSNPPYIEEQSFESLQREVREHEPRGALTSGADGLNMIRHILTNAPAFLVPGGHLLFEIGFNQYGTVSDMIDRATWTPVDIHKDLQGIPRVVVLKK
jgi:release factor glutamine methyltransferase